MSSLSNLKFDKYGYLPTGCYNVTLGDIKKFFVDNFSESKTRLSRWEGFLNFYNDLMINVKSCPYIWIDGSFISSKLNPNDIDFTIFIDEKNLTDDEFSYIIEELNYKEDILLEFDEIKYSCGKNFDKFNIQDTSFFHYACDFFLCYIKDENDENYSEYVQSKEYWKTLWGNSRKGISKGFLCLKVMGRI